MMPLSDAREAALALHFRDCLAPYRNSGQSLFVRVMDSEQEQPLELPAPAVSLLMDVLDAVAAGRAVSIIPESGKENTELTTVQAAAMLNVSRPYFIKLLREGAIPYRKVGTHRRILRKDVMNYKGRIGREREAVLDQLAADAQEHDMGYVRA